MVYNYRNKVLVVVKYVAIIRNNQCNKHSLTRPPENNLCPSTDFFYLNLSVKAHKLRFLSTRDKTPKCVCHRQHLSATGIVCLSQKIIVCHRNSMSVTGNLCLLQTICVCHWRSVSAIDILCLSQPFQLKYTWFLTKIVRQIIVCPSPMVPTVPTFWSPAWH